MSEERCSSSGEQLPESGPGTPVYSGIFGPGEIVSNERIIVVRYASDPEAMRRYIVEHDYFPAEFEQHFKLQQRPAVDAFCEEKTPMIDDPDGRLPKLRKRLDEMRAAADLPPSTDGQWRSHAKKAEFARQTLELPDDQAIDALEQAIEQGVGSQS